MPSDVRPWSTCALDLPTHIEELRQQAKKLYLGNDFAEAKVVNTTLARSSRAEGCVLGEVLGLRFAGLCEYRAGKYEDSAKALRHGMEKALEHGLRAQRLYIANHLGATLRRLGKLEEAYEMLRSHLDEVHLPDDIEAKARLLGNLGALLDDIGDVRAADDCYARYEELVELWVRSGHADDVARLANARALSARAALRRGDLETAERKYAEEFDLAQKSNAPLRKLDATLHRAKITLERGLRTQENAKERALHFEKAGKHFDEAQSEAEKSPLASRVVDVLRHRGRLFEAEGKWADAYEVIFEARRKSDECKYLYGQAETSLALARLCQRWALHGESLHWFRDAARVHHARYQPLLTNKRIASMAQTRLVELKDVATSLIMEARQVERPGDELADVQDLVVRIMEKPLPTTSTGAIENALDWQKRIRAESRQRWADALSPERYERLGDQSRGDLVMADLLYHGVIDDLARSALLLASVVERELRERLFVPLHESYSGPRKGKGASKTEKYFMSGDPEKVMLGKAFPILKEILDEPEPTDDALVHARAQIEPIRRKLVQVLRLDDPIVLPNGRAVGCLREIRNLVAHGNPGAGKLDRMTVDALKRRLILEPPGILASLIDIDLRPPSK